MHFPLLPRLRQGVTVSETWLARLRVPLVAVIVTVYGTAGVLGLVANVSVDVPDVVTDVGLKVAGGPAGATLAVRVTVPVKPPVGVMVAVYVVLEPAVIEREGGETDSVKSGGAAVWTTSVTDVV